MKSFIKNISLKQVLCAVLTFILALCIVFCALASIMRVTFFNRSFLSDTLNSSEYYKDLCSEINDNLTDLGNASGLDKSFFGGFVNELLVREDVQTYISDFYDGKKLSVNTQNFEDSLRTAVNKYIKANGIKIVEENNINLFVAKACKIYSGSIKISYMSSIQNIALKYRLVFTCIIIGLLMVSAIIICVIAFSSEWKHKAVRCVYYAVSSAGLFLLIIPVSVFASGVIDHIAIISRSLSDMYVSVLNTVFTDILIVSVVLLVLSFALWIIHGKIRQRASI